MLLDLNAVRSTLSTEEGHRTLILGGARKPSSGATHGSPRTHHPLNTLSSALTTINRTLRRPRLSVGFVIVALVLAGLGVWGITRLLRPKPYQPTPDAARLFNIGTAALRDGSYYQASKTLEQAVKTDDKFALAHARLAEAWMELDYGDKAKDELLRVSALVPDQSVLTPIESLYLDGIRATVTRNHQQGIESYRQIAALTPKDAQVYVDLGRAYEKNEEIGKAIESFVQATNLDAQYATAYLRLGILYGRKQDTSSALAAFDKAYELYQTLGIIEGRTEVYFQRGYLFSNSGKPPQALPPLQQALELARTTNNQYQQIKTLLQLSSTVAQNNPAEAKTFAQEAIQLARAGGMETLTSRGLVVLGNVYFGRGEYAEAEKYFKQSLELAQRYNSQRNEARARFSLGSLRLQQGKTDEETIGYIEQALPFYQQGGYNKESSQCLILLGRISRRKGDFDGALQRFQQLLELARKVGDASQESLSQQGIGGVLLRQGRYTEALAHYDEDLAINKNLNSKLSTGYSQLSRADMLWRLGRSQEAHAALDEAFDLAAQSDSKAVWSQAAIVDAELALSEKRFAEARSRAEQILARASSETDILAEARRILGLVQIRSGAKHEGRLSCEQALELAKSSGDVWLVSEAQLALAEAMFEDADAEGAFLLAQQAQESFTRSGQADAGWRALLIAARAAARLGDQEAARGLRARSVAMLSSLEQKWGAESYQGYLNRQDIRDARQLLEAENR
jgi:tetratricopeptide (TPR) repeat protein